MFLFLRVVYQSPVLVLWARHCAGQAVVVNSSEVSYPCKAAAELDMLRDQFLKNSDGSGDFLVLESKNSAPKSLEDLI